MSPLNKQENISEQKQQAIDWLVLLRSDDMSDDQLCEFAEWLALDHANAEAFSSAETLFDQMTAVSFKSKAENRVKPESSPQLTNIQSKQDHSQAKASNRLFVLPFAIAATLLLAVVLFFPQKLHLLNGLLSDYHTQTGELKKIVLSDGSRLLLNTNSAVSVDYNESIRTVILHYGQVRFSVANEASHPFEVRVGNLNVRALGTVFQIHKPEKGDVKITVQEHAVTVSMETVVNHSEPVKAITVQVGEQLLYQLDNSLALALPKKIELQQETAWQRQRLIINDQPLSDLIIELERYRDGQIFVADKKLNDLRITGVFSLSNPQEILNKICKVLDLKQTHIGAWSMLYR